MEKYNKKLEIVAYSLVIAMTLFTGAFIAYSYLPQSVQKPVKIEKGFLIPTFDEKWGEYEKTVILALSTKCKFCTESAGFYQKLTNKFSKSNRVRIIALFPQEKQESEKYLNDLGVDINVIKQSKLSEVQVKGTPTIILADKDRRVINSWGGKLDETSETEVLNTIDNK